MSEPRHLAIAGATGAVGAEMLLCLEQRNFPVRELTLLASARSAGKTLRFRGKEIVVKELRPESFAGVDIALFSAGSGISKEFAPHAVEAGAVVIDNSSAFRMDEGVPLVVPEVNGADALQNRGIIANPNCTTIVTLMALNPLHRAFGGVKKIIASSYQAVSGSGAQGIVELEAQSKAIAAGEALPEKRVYPRQIAFNVIPQVDVFLDNGYTKEEMKMHFEGRKILHAPDLVASVTCVRVPVYRSHAVAVTAQFADEPSIEAAREAIEAAPGVHLMDDISAAPALYPTPLDATDGDDCLVGRLRRDLVLEKALTFWVVGDQVRKGAALNAVQIAELL
ncbi:MAG: aspartate-semialdehyde dehydrogenase [Akkermansiaceae bacterium]|nr:aspartate-semialdehyde dehydrogenase [Akkermansiaceae bacterium]MCP5551957.1 aspartate-semialdehyde dehydrogenase [Akkermansiaceae bacterium]